MQETRADAGGRAVLRAERQQDPGEDQDQFQRRNDVGVRAGDSKGRSSDRREHPDHQEMERI